MALPCAGGFASLVFCNLRLTHMRITAGKEPLLLHECVAVLPRPDVPVRYGRASGSQRAAQAIPHKFLNRYLNPHHRSLLKQLLHQRTLRLCFSIQQFNALAGDLHSHGSFFLCRSCIYHG